MTTFHKKSPLLFTTFGTFLNFFDIFPWQNPKNCIFFFLYFFVLFMLFSWFLLSFKYDTFSSKRDFFFFFFIYKNYRKIQKSKKYMWVAVCPGHRHLWSHSGQLYQSSKPQNKHLDWRQCQSEMKYVFPVQECQLPGMCCCKVHVPGAKAKQDGT